MSDIFSQWTSNNNDQWLDNTISDAEYQWQPIGFTNVIQKRWFSESSLFNYESDNVKYNHISMEYYYGF